MTKNFESVLYMFTWVASKFFSYIKTSFNQKYRTKLSKLSNERFKYFKSK